MAPTQCRLSLPLLLAVLILALSLSGLPFDQARADIDYVAFMTGEDMVPPTSSPGHGTFFGTFDNHVACPGRGTLDFYVTSSNLEGYPSALSFWTLHAWRTGF